MEVLVLFDYDGQAEDELTIRKGDVIVDVKKLDGGWWRGRLKTLKGSIQGLFPDNFVMVVTEAEMSHPSSVVVRSEKGRKCRALFSYTPSHEDELELTVGDEINFLGEVEEGWWRGKLGGKIGVFPSNFVVIEDPTPSTIHIKGLATNPLIVSSDIAPELPPKPLKETARVLFPYSALQPDELELREGDLVIIHSKDCEDKGWWKGEVNNKIGVFPDNFVEILPNNSNSNNAFSKPLHPTPNISLPSCLTKTPQLRSGSSKNESGSFSSTSTMASDRCGVHASVMGNIVENPISLSDEQKLQQVEADVLNVIAPTESLSHITTSRARPTKSRRPPSTLFIKDSENGDINGGNPITSSVVCGSSIHEEDLGKDKLLLPVEQQQPKTKIRNSIKPPWMEELKRNQEKKEKGSFTTSMGSSIDEPAIPSVKPITSKVINTSTDVSNSEGDSFIRVNDPVYHKIGQTIKPSSSPGNSEVVHPRSSNISESPTLTSGLNFKISSSTITVPPDVVNEKRVVDEIGILSLKGYPEAGLNSLTVEEIAKQKCLSTFSSKVTNQSVGLQNHHPVNLDEVGKLSKSEDTIQRDLQTLHLRVASLEATVRNLQMELLHLKNSSASEHCRCTQKANTNESSLLHI